MILKEKQRTSESRQSKDVEMWLEIEVSSG